MKTQVLPITPESVALAAKLLQQGELWFGSSLKNNVQPSYRICIGLAVCPLLWVDAAALSVSSRAR